MKKVFFFLAALSMGMIASAQFTVGLTGGFSFPGMKIEEKGIDNTSYTDMQSSYNAMLKFGYILNERMSAGIGLGYQSSKSSSLQCNIQMPDYTKHPGENVSQCFENSKSSAFLITPYFRFNLASYGALNLFVEAQVPVSIGTTSMEEEFKDSKNSKLDEVVPFVKTSTMGLGVQVVPGLNYEITDHITVDVYMNFVGLGFNMYTTKTSEIDGKSIKDADATKNTYTMFGFNNFDDYSNKGEWNLGTTFAVALNVAF